MHMTSIVGASICSRTKNIRDSLWIDNDGQVLYIDLHDTDNPVSVML